jgi:hypothetical protein
VIFPKEQVYAHLTRIIQTPRSIFPEEQVCGLPWYYTFSAQFCSIPVQTHSGPRPAPPPPYREQIHKLCLLVYTHFNLLKPPPLSTD